MTLEFRVFGVAVPKGNMRPFMITSKKTGMQFPILTESNRNVKSWSQLVAEGANHALGERPASERAVVMDGVRLTVAFYLPRPKKYQKRGVNPAHLTAPDLDKLVRAIKDALTHVIWHDDSQVIELVARKDYAAMDDSPHVDVRIEPAFGGTTIAVPKADAGSVLPLFEATR
jgi:crossover junction endodeoxyribonuclease RusA